MLQYRRVLLKLSGEVLTSGKDKGNEKENEKGEDRNAVLDFDATRRIGKEIKAVHEAGIELSMVVGGGNILRGREVEKLGIERSQPWPPNGWRSAWAPRLRNIAV
jgi:uridylate kinase